MFGILEETGPAAVVYCHDYIIVGETAVGVCDCVGVLVLGVLL